MTITLDLAPDVETYLQEKAAREGRPTEVVAQALFAQAIQSDLQTRQVISLEKYGIDSAQAAELRASLASFSEDWNQPEMDVYDDYDAARASLDAQIGAKS